MRIQLSDHFTYNKLLRFVLPSITMMIFTSIYSVVDGFFVSNFVGKTPFAAINLIMPVLFILSSIGLMIGAGGTAIVGKTLGENDREQANKYFSMLVCVIAVAGVVFGTVGFFAIRPLAMALGAEGAMLEDCVLYGRVIVLVMPFQMMQMSFQSFFITAEKPKLGLATTVIAGVSNIMLDVLFIVVFQWGLFGAAFATALSQTLGAVIALVYFLRKNDSLLRLTTKTKFYGKVLLRSCTNGSSEMVSNVAASLVSMLYNYQLMRFAGENGVAAYGVIMYVSFIFSAIFYGYSMGSAPIISYQFGAGNHNELKNMFRKSMVLMAVTGSAMLLLVIVAADPLAKVFVGYDQDLYDMTVHAFRIFAIAFLLTGFSTFASAFFTALNDGKISAAIAFLRTLLFETSAILIIPALLGLDGVWWAIVVAEFAAFIVTIAFLIMKRKKYRYA
ncbi:MATE family efflux transporter [Desulfosporosinus meridiei]|uniref:Multidrug export protein MepA n=1 Tax=Desulfosporosinus meridiei (strain ATCC BAA-275 / DSM 13257 / KCTC 12902 / NCIMB 13706 / S10) TaxID=768704 RepID=J7IUH4_DESMD|nr:MATE family efflux transporter [Desulfosporosinus meridiei]AFQ43789.1 putative efflux protein, MATE family [Desulfosporosinus meridiei DSM 13257]